MSQKTVLLHFLNTVKEQYSNLLIESSIYPEVGITSAAYCKNKDKNGIFQRHNIIKQIYKDIININLLVIKYKLQCEDKFGVFTYVNGDNTDEKNW